MLIQFSTEAERIAFMNDLKTRAPELHRQMKPSYAQPEVVIVRPSEQMSEEQVRLKLQDYVGSNAEIFEDVQFKTMQY